MSELSSFQQQFRVTAPDGTTQYGRAGKVFNPFEAISDEAVGTVIQAGMAGRIVLATSVIPRTDRVASGASPAADLPQTEDLHVVRVAAATDVGLPGVATADCASGQKQNFAGSGSMICVQTTAAAITVGHAIVGGAAGLCTGTPTPTVGCTLGVCIKSNIVASPGTGVTGQAGVLISQR